VWNAHTGGQRGGAGLAGGLGLAEAKQQTQEQGALGEGGRHGRDPFVTGFKESLLTTERCQRYRETDINVLKADAGQRFCALVCIILGPGKFPGRGKTIRWPRV
jgi:hypothetical protein